MNFYEPCFTFRFSVIFWDFSLKLEPLLLLLHILVNHSHDPHLVLHNKTSNIKQVTSVKRLVGSVNFYLRRWQIFCQKLLPGGVQIVSKLCPNFWESFAPMGLLSKYPQFVTCTFTFPQGKMLLKIYMFFPLGILLAYLSWGQIPLVPPTPCPEDALFPSLFLDVFHLVHPNPIYL